VPAVGEAASEACAALLVSLPVEIDPGVRRRPVTGDQRLTAAYGDPPVTLECGVPDPDRPEQPAVVNGVEWSVRDIGAGFRWTTVGREVNVAVDIPDAYPNGAELVLPLADPIEAALPASPSPEPSPSP
jgi:hypothetical protein